MLNSALVDVLQALVVHNNQSNLLIVDLSALPVGEWVDVCSALDDLEVLEVRDEEVEEILINDDVVDSLSEIRLEHDCCALVLIIFDFIVVVLTREVADATSNEIVIGVFESFSVLREVLIVGLLSS